MFDTFVGDMKMIGCAMLLLLGAWLANAALGLFYNTTFKQEQFDKKKLLLGLWKVGAVAIGTALASVVISLFPPFLTEYGISIQSEAMETFRVVVVAGLYAVAIVKYLKECISKLADILK